MLIRKAQKEDAKEILDLVKTVFTESPYFPNTAEEFDITVEEEEEYIEKIAQFLVCEMDKQIVGSSTLILGKYKKVQHTALLGITILKPYTGQGIGTKMLTKMINLAKEDGIEIIELEVFEQNTTAYNLYKKFGFEVIGIKENFIKTDKGYENILLMTKRL